MATKRSLKGKQILVTCGPTWVALDQVRVISNISSGELGHRLVQSLKASGATVTLLEGPVTHIAKFSSVKVIKFRTFDEFAILFRKELAKKYNCVIHAAAVSDYRPQHAKAGKMPSGFRSVNLRLVPTEKLIADVKTLSPQSFLVGFKLEHRLGKQFLETKVSKLFDQYRCNLVVANGQSGRRYQALIFDQSKNVLTKASSRKEIATRIVEILGKTL